MNSISPVLTEKEVEAEQVVALDQSEYLPIVVVRVKFSDGSLFSMVRFQLTEKEKKLISEGADLLISQPHHGPMMPIAIQLAMPGEYPCE